MHPQLQLIADEFEEARSRLRTLLDSTPDRIWRQRPQVERWSVGECVAHLNLTSAAYVPLLRDGVAKARQLAGGPPPARYRRDPVGWFLWRTAGPPVRFRVETAPPFVPHGTDTPRALVEAFELFQDAQVACVREGDGLPLGRVKITSPFDARIRYNLFACLSILPRHQHRHLWQAEQVAATFR